MSLVSLEDSGELSNLRRDLKSGVQDSLLSLESHVLRPLDESSKINLGSDVTSDSVVSGSLLEESRMRIGALFLRAA